MEDSGRFFGHESLKETFGSLKRFPALHIAKCVLHRKSSDVTTFLKLVSSSYRYGSEGEVFCNWGLGSQDMPRCRPEICTR